MGRPRLYTPEPIGDAATVVLAVSHAHYLGRVLRMKIGGCCVLFDGNGLDHPATIVEIGRHQVTLELSPPITVATESPLHTGLLLAVTRGSRMDVAIQKSVELGATMLAPVFTQRCGVRLDPRQATQRMSHWEGVIISAAEQCGRARLPRLMPAVDLAQRLADLPERSATRLVLEPEAETPLSGLPPPTAGIIALVGPEGGLAPGEEAAARAHGFQGIRLGPRILRAETAPLALLAAIQTLWGDFTTG